MRSDRIPSLPHLPGSYVRIAQWALFLNLGAFAFRDFLSADGAHAGGVFRHAGGARHERRAGLHRSSSGNLGAPALGVRGASIATLGTNIDRLDLSPRLSPAHARGRPVRHIRPVLAVGLGHDGTALPAWLARSLSRSLPRSASFPCPPIMMGWVGTIELAAHGIALQVISVIFMVPLGFAFAATARVGNRGWRGAGSKTAGVPR